MISLWIIALITPRGKGAFFCQTIEYNESLSRAQTEDLQQAVSQGFFHKLTSFSLSEIICSKFQPLLIFYS